MRGIITVFLAMLAVTPLLLTGQSTTVRIGAGSGSCGTTTNPCPTTLCTGSSGAESPSIVLPAGATMTYSFDQGGGCGGSTGYRFDNASDNISYTINGGSSTVLTAGPVTTGQSSGSGSFVNSTASAQTYVFTANTGGTVRRDEAILFTYEIELAAPIQLATFTGEAKGNSNYLSWTTSSELNNDYMAVERSANGVSFQEVGRVQGNGSSALSNTYTFQDETPLPGTNYYRLRQVDFDGSSEYHRVIAVRSAASVARVVRTANLQQMLYMPEALQNGEVRLYNLQGQEVAVYPFAAGTTQLELNTPALASGIYLLQLRQGNVLQTMHFVK